MNPQENKQDFTNGSIFGKLIHFMLPVLGALILQATYGAVDLLIVGKFGTNAGISGVSTGSGIMNLITYVMCAIASGVTIIIGLKLGEKKQEQVGRVIGNAVAFFLVISVVLTVILCIFDHEIALLMQAPKEALDVTAEYIRVCGIGCVFIVFYNLLSAVFRGLGDSKTPLLFVAIACIVNIIGDLVLVAVFDLNVLGAAIATVGAQAVSVILSLWIIKKRKFAFSFSVKDIRFGKETRTFLKVGTPLALQDLLTNLSFLALCAFVNRLGLDASNGYGIAQKIVSFIMLIPAALMQSMASFVAQNVGAGKEERAQKGMLYGMALGSCIGVVIGILVFARGDLLAAVFSSNTADIIRAHEYLKGFALEAVITCILFSYIGYFNGHSKSGFVMIQGLAQSFLVRLPISYFMSIKPNASLTEIGFAAPAATIFGIALCTVYFLKMQKKEKVNFS